MESSNSSIRKRAKGLWQTTQIKMALVMSAVFIGAYVAWFVGKMGFGLSPRPEDWGYFGSYTAGTIGMAFALSTVWMLAETLKAQREELELTRAELEKSSSALSRQVMLAEESRANDVSYYLVRTIDANIETICNQTFNNLPNTYKVWTYASQKVENRESEQIRAIVDNYMYLIKLSCEPPNKNYTLSQHDNSLTRLMEPMTLKYRDLLTKAMSDGYFSKYSRREVRLVKHRLLMRNVAPLSR